jgi:type VI secretion system secreted protein VgrG
MEVIVSFIGGDPDRPIVTGCVYNGTNAPPYALPDEKTKSTIKTSSSPGGDGFNELRFEDAKGSEEVFLHAQRDLREVIERNQSTSVGANESLSVGANQSIDVKGNRSVTVKGSETVTIKGEAVGKQPPPPVARALTIAKGDHTITVTEGAMTVSAAKMLTLMVGNTSIVLTPQAITFVAADGAQADFGSGIAMSAAQSAAEMLMDKTGTMSLSNKGTQLKMDSNVVLERGETNALKLDGAAKLSSDGMAKVELTANALMGGATVECKASGANIKLGSGAGEMKCLTSIEITAAPSSLNLGPGGAKVTSGAITSIDGGQVKVAGMLVAIN